MECGCEMLKALSVRPVPALDRRRRPFRRLVAVTVIACVRRAERCGDVRPRNAEAVVVPSIDDHVGAGRHMARRAGKGWVHGLVPMVAYIRILVPGVALQAGV